MSKLRISESLSLPLEAVTQTFAILAKRGVGKTHTAVVLVEEMIAASLPVVIVDPIGVWWGLRSSADGKGMGLPVVILGGEHGDLPLEEGAGVVVADFVIETRRPVVLDLGLFSKSGARRFMVDFAERLYRGKATRKEPLHVVLDEADSFIPQRVDHGAERLVGAINDLVRRGRARGLGVTLISQRPALVNKDVLTQIEVLVALRMTGPQDRDALERWIEHNADEAQAKIVLSSLAELPVGTAWVWSPGWLQKPLTKVAIRQRHTFDSSATPKMGDVMRAPKAAAAIDLPALQEAMRATIEKAKADDPKELRKRIAQLEKELNATATPAPVRVERVEIPAIATETLDVLRDMTLALARSADVIRVSCERVAARTRPEIRNIVPDRVYPSPKAAARVPTRPAGEAPALRSGARRMLEVLAKRHPSKITRAQLATFTCMAKTGGTFLTYLSDLRRCGFADTNAYGFIEISEAGLAEIGAEARDPQTRDEVLSMWRGALRAGAWTMLETVLARGALSRSELAGAVNMAEGGGTFLTYLSDLRRNGLVETAGGVVRTGEALVAS